VAEGKVVPLDADAGFPRGGNCYVANDGRGTVWIATGNQLGVMREGRWEAVQKFPQPGLCLTGAADAGLWVCAGNRLFRYEPGQEPVELALLPPRVQVQTLLAVRNGALWIATAYDGLFRWQNGLLERVPTSNSQISSLAEDREGNLWVGTAGGGLNRLRARTVEVIGKEDGLPYESMRSICEDASGVRWAVTDNGLLLRSPGNRWDVAGPESGWRQGAVANCVAADRDGAVWVGASSSSAGLVRLQQGESRQWTRDQGLVSSSVRSILVAAKGDVWLASGAGQLQRLRGDTLQGVEMNQELRRSPRAMAETADGTIWAGTAEGQLVRVNPDTLKAEVFFPDERPLSIRGLSATPDGSLWIGYAGWGIGRWKDGRHARLTAEQGLFDDYVSQILPDERGNLWLNSNHGLFVVRLSELIDVFDGRAQRVRSINYGRGEGLPSLQPRWDYHPSVWHMASGSLFFALRNGLAVVRAQKMVENQQLPPVVVERVAIDERTVARYAASFPLRPVDDGTNLVVAGTEARLTVPPRHQKIEMQFAALSYSSPENVQMRYRLKNFDQGWSDAGSLRSARYPRLPAGDYEFEVEACNEAGLWSKAPQRVALRVLPFFWRTWWFQMAVLVLFTGVIIGLVRYFSFQRLRRELFRLEQRELLHRERARIARDLHDDVGASLAQISVLGELANRRVGQPEALREQLARVMQKSRQTMQLLDQVVWTVNPRNDSLARSASYFTAAARNLLEGSGIRCRLRMPDELPSAPISSRTRHQLLLAVKEAVGNVLKHSGADEMVLALSVAGQTLTINITDNGRGFDPAALGAERNGLKNMPERMAEIGGNFNLQTAPGKGTSITLTAPLGVEA